MKTRLYLIFTSIVIVIAGLIVLFMYYIESNKAKIDDLQRKYDSIRIEQQIEHQLEAGLINGSNED